MFTNKEQLCQSFWQSVKKQKFKAKKIEGGSIWHPPPLPPKASRVKVKPKENDIKKKLTNTFFRPLGFSKYPKISKVMTLVTFGFSSLWMTLLSGARYSRGVVNFGYQILFVNVKKWVWYSWTFWKVVVSLLCCHHTVPSSLLNFRSAIFSRNVLRSVLRPFTMAKLLWFSLNWKNRYCLLFLRWNQLANTNCW